MCKMANQRWTIIHNINKISINRIKDNRKLEDWKLKVKGKRIEEREL